MDPPKHIKEIQKLNGRITALSRFIARSAEKSLPFFKILRRKARFEWTQECQKAFEELKGMVSGRNTCWALVGINAAKLYIKTINDINHNN
ncbi:hypothetical protein OROMI_033776 [Orobanche minor]